MKKHETFQTVGLVIAKMVQMVPLIVVIIIFSTTRDVQVAIFPAILLSLGTVGSLIWYLWYGIKKMVPNGMDIGEFIEKRF